MQPFNSAKDVLLEVSTLSFPFTDASISISTDAFIVGAASCHLPSHKYFRYFVEGQQFHVFTDQKPLTTVVHNNKSSYTSSCENALLSHSLTISTLCLPPLIDYAAVAADQVDNSDLQQLKENAALQMRKIQISGIAVQLYANVSTSGLTCLSAIATQSSVSTRFEHVRIDLVGSLPFSRGYRYLLTCVGRLTRWTEAVPLADITTDSVTRAFNETWVSRFGVPLNFTSDFSSQFESYKWGYVMTLLGIHCFRSTRYHPQANGTVERFQCQLKASLAASSSRREKWTDTLPLSLLSIRTALKENLQHSSAKLVYGTTLRFVQDFARSLKESLASLQPVQLRTSSVKTFASQGLESYSHVFLRVDGVRRPLQYPYQGSFKVIHLTRKTFTLDVNGASQTVAIDSVKLAYLLQIVPHQGAATATSVVFSAATQLGLRSKRKIQYFEGITVERFENFV
ncbi:uncharacterized protein LOC123509284 [Portunus trituberculatus]|uniref:uncharacterized protein LOC123509284 n=1 Tax=Portunus trituberculatus TaxID=210409 RepID=UPI001E1CFB39|nr:uncharacterized protein LOC123509284 [Portunus trituberculatus]